MKPIILLVTFSFLVAQCSAKESSSSSVKPSRSNSGNKLEQPPLMLDLNLRRALLKALEELELEAQEKVAANGSAYFPNPRASKTSESARALEQVLNEFQKNTRANQAFDNSQNIDSSLIRKVQDFVVLNQPGFVAVEEVPADSKRVRVSTEETKEVIEETTTTPEQQESLSTEQSTSDALAEKQGQVLYFKNSEPIVVASEDSMKKDPETRSAVLDDKEDETLTPPGVIDIEPNLIPEVEKSQKSEDSANVTAKKEKTLEDHEVKIFQAPLVAAFTLHQDAQGQPKSVVPLYRSEGLIKPVPTQNTIRDVTNIPFQALTREQELEQKTRELEQQLLSLQRQQFQQQRLQYQEQQDQLQRQQQLLLDEQLRQRRFQEEQQRQQQIQRQHQQQQYTSSSRLRSQRQEQGTGNFGIVDFQPSISFQYPSQQNHQQPQQQQPQQQQQQQQQQPQQKQQQQQRQQQSNNIQSTNFLQQQQLPNIQSANYYQQQLPTVQPTIFLNNPQQVQHTHQSNFFNNQQQQQQQQKQQQQQHQQRNNFNTNNNFQVQNSQQIPVQQNDFRPTPVYSNFLFNSQNQVNQIPLRRPQPQSADSQIQGLLFRSGVAGGAQEDLNIVSKVLSLNHEGTKNNDISLASNGRNQRNTAEGTFGSFRQPERYISPPLH